MSDDIPTNIAGSCVNFGLGKQLKLLSRNFTVIKRFRTFVLIFCLNADSLAIR